MKNNYVFFITQRGDRTNILSNFKVIGLDEVKEYLKTLDRKEWRNMLRYAKIGGYAQNSKDMLLDEYEFLFGDCEFKPEVVTAFFRKEISDKYGEHKVKNEKKAIPKMDLEVGRVYKDKRGFEYLYMGLCDVDAKYIFNNYYWKDRIDENKFVEYCYADKYHFENKTYETDCQWRGIEHTKSCRQFYEKTDKFIELTDIDYVDEKNYLRIKFLDKK